MDHFLIRQPRKSDLNLIQNSFAKTMKTESRLGRSCSSKLFYSKFQNIIDYILDRSSILIAAAPEDHDVILGYLIYEPGIIHYAFVKYPFRRLNIIKDLVHHAFPDAKSLEFSLWTNSAKAILQKHEDQLIHNPFHLYKGLNNE